MLNYIWAAMIMIGVSYAAFTGNMNAVTNAAIDSAGEGISLCIKTAGVMALWMGLMEIAQKSGMIQIMTKWISPFLDFCFPRIPKYHKSREYMATNIIANILGLGWACTPAGLKAMEELANLERERGNPGYEHDLQWSDQSALDNKKAKKNYLANNQKKTERAASNEMCTFLILNISSLQLIPVNMIAYRSQYGSVNPASIIAPSIFATLISTIAAIIYIKLKDKK